MPAVKIFIRQKIREEHGFIGKNGIKYGARVVADYDIGDPQKRQNVACVITNGNPAFFVAPNEIPLFDRRVIVRLENNII